MHCKTTQQTIHKFGETSTGDVGIDGNLEFVNPDGFATGKAIAVQVKSGPFILQA